MYQNISLYVLIYNEDVTIWPILPKIVPSYREFI